jgi:NAD+ synthetase
LSPATIAGRRIGFLVCEDLWDEGYPVHPPADLLAAGADLLVCISASPYRRSILPKRLAQARRPGCPLVYLNLCGATDELIFDGRSFVFNQAGRLIGRLAGFKPEVKIVDLDRDHAVEPAEESPEAELYQALALGVRDFATKNRLERAFVGLSGGVDSAVVAALAAEALGPERVTAVAIPSRYTDPRSTACARELAQALGIGFEVRELDPLHSAAETTLGDLLVEGGTTAENIQARLRGMILMSIVNRYGGMLLNTSNKTELALGYATLYGDMAGALCPIADLTKPEVVALARWINATRSIIPAFTLERPPSAELRPDQVDPFDYARVAPAMERLVQENRSDAALRRSEHKRWQMGVILKVSEKAFGTGRMIPITRR